jgi:hypothetical protein
VTQVRSHTSSLGVPRDPMDAWYTVAWVRLPEDDSAVHDGSGCFLFSPSLVPCLDHPRIVERGEPLARQLLAHRFYTYAHFTSVLEREAINLLLNEISGRYFLIDLPPVMYRGAGRIYTDEGFHAQKSDELLDSFAADTAISPSFLETPTFIRNLQRVSATLDGRRRRLVLFGFSVVSETLISSILSDLPRDPAVHPAVRQFIRQHARDEARHLQYFTNLMNLTWPALSKSDRQFLGPMLADFICWFLDPEFGWLRRFLAHSAFSSQAIEGIIGECYPADAVEATRRCGARRALALFSRLGIFDEPTAADAFSARGLM